MSYPRRPRNVRREFYDVEDLREKLNRIKLEKEQQGIPVETSEPKRRPPPDPTFNFLKDPLRDGNTKPRYEHKRNEHKPSSQERKNFRTDDNKPKNIVTDVSDKKADVPTFVPRQHWKQPRNFRGNFQNKQYSEKVNNKSAVFEKPIKVETVQNIKVEFSNDSGERKCTFDENLNVDVPVMPKQKFSFTQKPRKFFSQRPYKRYNPRAKFEEHRFSKDEPSDKSEDIEVSAGDGKSGDAENWDKATAVENKDINPSTENKINKNKHNKTVIKDNLQPEN